MSLGLIKPGASVALRHPKTGELIKPLGFLKSGKVVWPVLGAGPDDPDDPEFTRGADDEDDDDDEEEEDPKPHQKKRSVKKSEDGDSDDDDDEDDSRAHRASQQAKRYRLKLRDAERQNAELNSRLKALEDRDRDPDEVVSRDITELKTKNEALAGQNQVLLAQLAFFKSNTIDWIDPTDAYALAERSGLFDEVVDEDGNVDERELRRGLKDLAKRKPHLVKPQEDPKARGRKSTESDDEEEDDDEDEPRSRRSASTMNGGRKGTRQAEPSKSQLAKKFPVLNRL